MTDSGHTWHFLTKAQSVLDIMSRSAEAARRNVVPATSAEICDDALVGAHLRDLH
jgi:hypothetical protein